MRQLLVVGRDYRAIRFELLWRASWRPPIARVREDLCAVLDDMLRRVPEADDPADAADKFLRETYRPTPGDPRRRAQASRIGGSRKLDATSGKPPTWACSA